jgi:hypothetical protein
VLPAFLTTLTDNRSHWLTTRVHEPNAQQFGGFGPLTTAKIPVAVKVTPQFVLL